MINLLPESIKTERKYGKRNVALRNVAIACLLVALCILITVGWARQYLSHESNVIQDEISSGQETVNSLQQETERISDLSNRVENAYSLYESNVSFSKMIPEIGSLLPSGSRLNALNLTGESYDPISLDIELKNSSLAPVARQNLFESELFEDAEIASINSAADSEGEYKARATINVSFAGSKDAKAKEAARLKAIKDAKSNASEENR